MSRVVIDFDAVENHGGRAPPDAAELASPVRVRAAARDSLAEREAGDNSTHGSDGRSETDSGGAAKGSAAMVDTDAVTTTVDDLRLDAGAAQ